MKNFILFFVLLFTVSVISAQETPKPNYRAAAKYSPKNLAKMVHSTSVNPHWLKKGNRFWYSYKTSDGSNYYLVDVDKKSKKQLFDNVKMAKWLTEITKDPYDAKHLPRLLFKFNKAENAIRFRVTSTEEVEVEEKEEVKKDTISTKKAKKKKPKMEKKTYYLEYKLGGNGLTIIDTKKVEKKPWEKWANVSPDSTIVLYGKNHNIYWMDKINFKKFIKDEKDSTVVENQWTKDGEENYGYTWGGRGQDDVEKKKKKDDRKGVWGTWSHDSKKFVFQKSDSRHIKDLWVINSTKKGRPTLETYKYHMPGEQEYYKSELMIFDIPTKTHVMVPLDTVKQQSVSVYRESSKKTVK
jgi:hypothetical protein